MEGFAQQKPTKTRGSWHISEIQSKTHAEARCYHPCETPQGERQMRQILILATLIAALAAIACSDGSESDATRLPATAMAPDDSPGQPNPPTPDLTKEALIQELEELQENVETLRTQQNNGRAEVIPTPSLTKNQSTAVLPTAVTIPTPTGPGICGRSPQIQEAILLTIGSPYCRTVEVAELYRIRCFKENPRLSCTSSRLEWGFPGPKPGDFADLVNLSQLNIGTQSNIPAGTFTGSSIENLTLNVDGVDPGAFEGATIGTLTITAKRSLPENALPTSVTNLKLKIVTQPTDLRGDMLKGLSKLENLELALHAYENYKKFQEAVKTLALWDESKESWQADKILFHMPSDIFVTNTALKSVGLYARTHLDNSGTYPATANVDRSTFSGLGELEHLSIYNLQVRDHTSGTPPLALNTTSPLHRHMNSEDGSWQSWSYGEPLTISTPE